MEKVDKFTVGTAMVIAAIATSDLTVQHLRQGIEEFKAVQIQKHQKQVEKMRRILTISKENGNETSEERENNIDKILWDGRSSIAYLLDE